MMGSKDNGYIRANETIPYPPRQLAAFLNITEELLQSTITKCIQYGKLDEVKLGMWRITSWDNFKLSKSYKSELDNGKKAVPGHQRTESSLQRTNSSPIIEENIIEEKRIYTTAESFVVFWAKYPKRVGKGAALASWLKKNPPLDKCLKTLEWQVVSEQWKKDGGQFIPLPATWINQGRWEDVRPGYIMVNCSVCGEEGWLPQGYKGIPTCSKCKERALSAQIEGNKGERQYDK